MEHLVVVRCDAPDHFTPQALGFPDIRGEAKTETAAVDRVRQSLANWLGSGKLVSINVPLNGNGNPWLDSFERSACDPEFSVYLEELNRARQAEAAE